MGLSNDLISQFVKMTNDDKKDKKESTVYGTVVTYNGTEYVKLDGSDLLTPVNSTTEIVNGERVTVMIKDHTATVMGNITTPSASVTTTDNLGNIITQQGNTISQIGNVITQHDNRITQMGNTITQQNNTISQFNNTITQQNSTIETMNSTIKNQDSIIANINSEVVNQNSKIETLDSTVKTHDSSIDIYNSSFQVTDGVVTGIKGVDTEWISTKELEADHATIGSLDSNYANIDFANIGKAAFEYFYAKSGLIENVVVGDQTITGELVGVTIRGDRIIGNTIMADKLVIKGEDGLFYKLNTDGIVTEKEQTNENSLNGQVIMAKSITATKIDVKDLVAFNATIGGFKITDNSIYSGVKESVDNTTRGIYLDNSGQIAFGDASNYVKFHKVDDGSYKLDISADSITFGSGNKNIGTTVEKIRIEYALSDSTSIAPTSGWSETAPNWTEGKYMWQRNTTVYINGNEEIGEATCIAGATGQNGKDGVDAVSLQILSSNGHMFKNSLTSTTLTVEILVGGVRLTSSSDMYLYFGGNARIIWEQKKQGETEYTEVDSNDSRLSDNGFIFTINAEDLKYETVYSCYLDY